MKFYILFKNQTANEALELGNLSFKTFYGEVGLEALQGILESNNVEELLEEIFIKDERNKEYTITEFFNILEKSNIFTQKDKERK